MTVHAIPLVRSPLAASPFERAAGMLATARTLLGPLVAGLLLSWLLGLGWPDEGCLGPLPSPEIESVAHGGGIVVPPVLDEQMPANWKFSMNGHSIHLNSNRSSIRISRSWMH